MASLPENLDPLPHLSDSDWESDSGSRDSGKQGPQHTQSLPDISIPSVAHGRASPFNASPSSSVTRASSHQSATEPNPLGNTPESPNIYHPSDSTAAHGKHVMWVGNIPIGVNMVELRRLFNNGPSGGIPDTDADNQVVSIHMLDYTRCCFVNFRTRYALEKAISRFHNVSLRPDDPSAFRLVCRVRTKDDALKAGVNSQRGKGIHLKWVREKTKKLNRSRSTPSFPTLSKWQDPQQLEQDASSASIETTSSFLHEHFPNRYFIMKSITEAALQTSVRDGSWVTQAHNEGLLDQAFRTSQAVFLIFSVNRSGEFYGYAKLRSGKLVTAAVASVSGGQSNILDPEPGPSRPTLALPERMATAGTESSGPFHPARNDSITAPAELETAHRRRAIELGEPPHPAGERTWTSAPGSPQIRLAFPEAPIPIPQPSLPPDNPAESASRGITAVAVPTIFHFDIEWLSLDRVSFRQTRGYRNSWNHGREIKISRDGTELDPETGKRLIEQWKALSMAG